MVKGILRKKSSSPLDLCLGKKKSRVVVIRKKWRWGWAVAPRSHRGGIFIAGSLLDVDLGGFFYARRVKWEKKGGGWPALWQMWNGAWIYHSCFKGLPLGIWHLATLPISPSYSTDAGSLSDWVKEMGKCLDEEQLELMLVVAWALWSDRNLLLFQDIQNYPVDVVNKAISFL